MFGIGKKKDKPKKQGHLDKIVAGLIIGAAVGSVIGVSVAPQEGKATRKEVGKRMSGMLSRFLKPRKKKENREE